MGGRTAALIADRLVGEGLPPATAAIVISDVSRPTERKWSGTLERLADGIAEIGFDNPVLIAIGSALAVRTAAGNDGRDAGGLVDGPAPAKAVG